jgi:ubiquinone/menaquinone biosynthesis C-methylase UbiE
MNLKETYNLIAEDWAQEGGPHSDWCLDFLNIFASRVGNGGKVLDIGCGSGQDCGFLVEHGIKTTGVDFSEKMINEARKHFPGGKFLVLDIRELAFPKEIFDGVLAKHSLLHLHKKEMSAVLEKIHSILKPDGWFLLTLKEGIGEKVVSEVRFGHSVERFFSYFTNFEVKKLLEGGGFQIIQEGLHKGDRDTSLKFLVQKV